MQRLDAGPAENPSTVYRMNYPGTTTIGTIAIPVRDHLNAGTVTSLLMTDYSWVPAGYSVERSIIQGGILVMQRNEAVQRMEGDWLLFIDDDMVFSPDAVGKLVASREEGDYDILGGLCFRRSEPHQPTMYMREGPTAGGYNFLEDWEDGVVEVDATGMAFCIIHSRVFEAIAGSQFPPLAFRMANHPPQFFNWGNFGEDLLFCQAAKEAGCRVWVDTRIEIGHVGEKVYTKKDFLQQIALREPEVEEMRKEINDRMLLPTLTAEKAKEKLGWR